MRGRRKAGISHVTSEHAGAACQFAEAQTPQHAGARGQRPRVCLHGTQRTVGAWLHACMDVKRVGAPAAAAAPPEDEQVNNIARPVWYG